LKGEIMGKCPREEHRDVNELDVHEVKCPACGHLIEFFASDKKVKCPKCGVMVSNTLKDVTS
jgi:ribosomal protein S27E